VMPGVLIVEAMAQTSAILVMHSLQGSQEEKIVYFMSIEEARFRKPVVPGDRLHIQVQKIQARSTVWKFSGKAYVDDKLHAEAIYTAMIMDKK
ncbi:MAG: 3-hydroxyacyl-[acyl-carrier-protein] dehydratase FabZ, partial [Alphaproteobacteria bacterium]|nr:3-hydroxyacyl-[acyl-carrier-protein] dehydratase FabZ [Alphaproteobacteria bacterium]